MHLDAVEFLQITDPPRRHLRETLGGNILRRNATPGLKRLHEPTLARHHGLRKVRPDQIGNVIHLEPLAKLPGDWGWAQSSALLVNTIALDRRLDILSGEPAARRR